MSDTRCPEMSREGVARVAASEATSAACDALVCVSVRTGRGWGGATWDERVFGVFIRDKESRRRLVVHMRDMAENLERQEDIEEHIARVVGPGHVVPGSETFIDLEGEWTVTRRQVERVGEKTS